ncbi:MAG: hypothetical protein ACREWG_12530 [Gammaproteobacteria bacterium]
MRRAVEARRVDRQQRRAAIRDRERAETEIIRDALDLPRRGIVDRCAGDAVHHIPHRRQEGLLGVDAVLRIEQRDQAVEDRVEGHGGREIAKESRDPIEDHRAVDGIELGIARLVAEKGRAARIELALVDSIEPALLGRADHAPLGIGDRRTHDLLERRLAEIADQAVEIGLQRQNERIDALRLVGRGLDRRRARRYGAERLLQGPP